VGVLASAEPRGGDENVRQASACRHSAWRTMPNRAILESKVVRLSPSHAAAPCNPPITQRVSRNACRMYSRWVSSSILPPVGDGSLDRGHSGSVGRRMPS
jgi:hypothetical protein